MRVKVGGALPAGVEGGDAVAAVAPLLAGVGGGGAVAPLPAGVGGGGALAVAGGTGLDDMLAGMRGAKKRKEIDETLAQMRSKPKPKCPKGSTQTVVYGHGVVSCREDQRKWRVFMKAPYRIDLTRQWGAKGSRAAKFVEALEVIGEVDIHVCYP